MALSAPSSHRRARQAYRRKYREHRVARRACDLREARSVSPILPSLASMSTLSPEIARKVRAEAAFQASAAKIIGVARATLPMAVKWPAQTLCASVMPRAGDRGRRPNTGSKRYDVGSVG